MNVFDGILGRTSFLELGARDCQIVPGRELVFLGAFLSTQCDKRL